MVAGCVRICSRMCDCYRQGSGAHERSWVAQANDLVGFSCISPDPNSASRAAPPQPQPPLQLRTDRPTGFEDSVRQAAETSSTAPQFNFFLQAIVQSLFIPCGFFCLLLPLFGEKLYNELWEAYYWLLASLMALAFSEAVARLCFGTHADWRVLLIIACVAASLSVGPNVVGQYDCLLKVPLQLTSVFLSLYYPAFHRIVMGSRRGHPLTPLCFFLLMMTWGGTPSAVSVALYHVLLSPQWTESLGMLLLAVVIWTVAPCLVKPIGWELTLRAAPQNRFITPPIWVLYCDLAFGTLGLILFVRTPVTSLSYAVSVVPELAFHMFLGTRLRMRRCGGQARTAEDCRSIRLNIFLEAFTGVLGRAAAYTVYFCMSGVRFLAGAEDPLISRPSLLQPGRSVVTPNSVQIYRRSPGTMEALVAAVFGLAFIWCSFFIFCWLLPRWWTKRFEVVPEAGEELPRQSAQADASCTAVGVASAEVHGEGLGGWVFGAGRLQTQQQQYQVLVSFLNMCRKPLLTMVLFQFMICTVAVNNAEAIASDVADWSPCGELTET